MINKKDQRKYRYIKSLYEICEMHFMECIILRGYLIDKKLYEK